MNNCSTSKGQSHGWVGIGDKFGKLGCISSCTGWRVWDKGSELEMYETWVETKRVCQYVMEQTMADRCGLSARKHGQSWWKTARGGKGTTGRSQIGDLHHFYEVQHVQPAVERALTGASSSSACVAHVGVLTEERKTLSRFFNSFSRSMMSFFIMIAVINDSKSVLMPRRGWCQYINGEDK
jgi:hypothetical protein